MESNIIGEILLQESSSVFPFSIIAVFIESANYTSPYEQRYIGSAILDNLGRSCFSSGNTGCAPAPEYVDDRLSPTGCAFAHIPTRTTAHHRVDVDEEGRSDVMTVAPSAIGARTEIGRGYTLRHGSGCLTIGSTAVGSRGTYGCLALSL
jgi:hypothetical protein